MVNNRRRGIKWELEVLHDLQPIFPVIKTSRNESRYLDSLKVDLVHTDPFYFQCKLSNSRLKYDQILNSMPKESKINVIINKLTTKTKNRFIPTGKYAILNYSDFLEILKILKKDGRIS